MVRPATILGALFVVAIFTLPTAASGDAPLDTANRYETPPAVIMRILLSDRSDREKIAAIARFDRINDPNGTGKPRKFKVDLALAERLKELLPQMGKKNPVKDITPSSDDKERERPKDKKINDDAPP